MPSDTDATREFVIAESELTDTDRVIVDINGREIAVIKHDDNYYAFLNHCPHQSGPIGEGHIAGTFRLKDGGERLSDMEFDPERKAIACPWHGYEFDIQTGDHLVSDQYRIPTYPVEILDGGIYVRIP